jgi:hypothetical protein
MTATDRVAPRPPAVLWGRSPAIGRKVPRRIVPSALPRGRAYPYDWTRPFRLARRWGAGRRHALWRFASALLHRDRIAAPSSWQGIVAAFTVTHPPPACRVRSPCGPATMPFSDRRGYPTVDDRPPLHQSDGGWSSHGRGGHTETTLVPRGAPDREPRPSAGPHSGRLSPPRHVDAVRKQAPTGRRHGRRRPNRRRERPRSRPAPVGARSAPARATKRGPVGRKKADGTTVPEPGARDSVRVRPVPSYPTGPAHHASISGHPR